MQGDEIHALRRLQREQGLSSHVFMTERDGPMTPKAFHALFGRIGERAKMPFPVHPHMLRHACGYALANAGPRHPGAAGVARPQEHPAHSALHRAGAGQIQELLAIGDCGHRRDIGRGRSRSAYPPVQNDSGPPQGPAGFRGILSLR
jgi:hypothetical protein